MSFNHQIQAKVICDSISPEDVRLTTIEVTFHRFILAEVNTHRKFSRNSASSRAIPVKKTLERAFRHPAFPVTYPCEQPGMSGGTELTGSDLQEAQEVLSRIQAYTINQLTRYVEDHPDPGTRLHKSLLNRPLEWFMWHTAIISSTEWENFFHQRCHPAAQPEFRVLAEAIRDAMKNSVATPLNWGEWHLPYISDEEKSMLNLGDQVKVSTARCARVSYLTHDGIRNITEDIRMHDETLWSNGHWSPMEHPAVVTDASATSNFDSSWMQYRYLAENGIDASHSS